MKKTTLVLKLSTVAVAAAMVAGCNSGGGSSPTPSASVVLSSATVSLDNGYTPKTAALRSVSVNTDDDSDDLNLQQSQDIIAQYTGSAPNMPATKDGISFTIDTSSSAKCTSDQGKKCAVINVKYDPISVSANVHDSFWIGTANLNVDASVPARLFYTQDQYSYDTSNLEAQFSTTDPKSKMQFNVAAAELPKSSTVNADGSVSITIPAQYSGGAYHFGNYRNTQVFTIRDTNGKTFPVKITQHDLILARGFEITTSEGNIYKQDTMSQTEPSPIQINEFLGPHNGYSSEKHDISYFDTHKPITNFVLDRSQHYIGIPSNIVPVTMVNGQSIVAEISGEDASQDRDLLETKGSVIPGVTEGDKLLAKSLVYIPDYTNGSLPESVAVYKQNNNTDAKILIHKLDLFDNSSVSYTLKGSGVDFSKIDSAVMAVSRADNGKIYLLMYLPDVAGNKFYSASISESDNYADTTTLYPVSGLEHISGAVVYTAHSFDPRSGNRVPEDSKQPQYLAVNNDGVLQLLDPTEGDRSNPITVAEDIGTEAIPQSFACGDFPYPSDTTSSTPVCHLVYATTTPSVLKILDIYNFSPFNKSVGYTADTTPMVGGTTIKDDQCADWSDSTKCKAVVDGDTGSLAVLDSSSGAVNIYKATEKYQTRHPVNLNGEQATGIYDY